MMSADLGLTEGGFRPSQLLKSMIAPDRSEGEADRSVST